MTLRGTAAELPVIILTNEPEARNEEERRLLEQGLVLEVVAKSSVHENPRMLPRVIEEQLESIDRVLSSLNQPRLSVERFRTELPEGEHDSQGLPVERFEREQPRPRAIPHPGSAGNGDTDDRDAEGRQAA
jgi:hypothetical protein